MSSFSSPVPGRSLTIKAALAVVAVFCMTSTAGAECRRGCNLEKRDCNQVARTTQLSCKLDCRVNAARNELGACMHTCRDTYRAEKSDCKTLRGDCRHLCEAPAEDPGNGGDGGNGGGVDGQCVSSCAHDLGDCARESSAGARACRKGDCAGLRGRERATCTRNCAAVVQENSGLCVSIFMDCMTGCGAVPTTTSTTSTMDTATSTSVTMTTQTSTSTSTSTSVTTVTVP